MIFPISASQVAGILGVGYLCLAWETVFETSATLPQSPDSYFHPVWSESHRQQGTVASREEMIFPRSHDLPLDLLGQAGQAL
jgi:hypothetical protein